MKNERKAGFLCVCATCFLLGIFLLTFVRPTSLIFSSDSYYRQLWDLILVMICIISLFFHILYYYYVPKTISHLYFGLLSASVGISLLFRGSCLIFLLLPGLTQDWYLRIFLLSYSLRIVSLLLYIESIFSKEILRMVFRFLLILTLTLTMIIFLSPLYLLEQMLTAFCIITLFSAILSFYVSLKGYVADYIGASYYIIAFLLLTLGSYSDLLYNMSFSSLPSQLFLTQILFVILQSFLQAKQHYSALNNTRELTHKINETLSELQDNKSTFISSHIKPAFLSETLEVISNTCESDPTHADTLILALATYLRQMLDFDGKNKIYPLSKELELIRAYRTIVAEHNPNLKIVYEIPDELPNIDLVPLSIQTLLENAVLHAFPAEKDDQKILLSITESPISINIMVTDNGIGMTEQEITYALEFPNRNLNVGLYDLNLALKNRNHSCLSILSRIGSGTVVSYSLPLEKEDFYA